MVLYGDETHFFIGAAKGRYEGGFLPGGTGEFGQVDDGNGHGSFFGGMSPRPCIDCANRGVLKVKIFVETDHGSVEGQS